MDWEKYESEPGPINLLILLDTDLPAYSDTVYSDTPLTVTL